jgi:hypothetical protein
MLRAMDSRKTQARTTLRCDLSLSVDRPHQGSYLQTNGKFPAEIERATVWGQGREDTVA